MITTSFWAVFEIKFRYLQVLLYFSPRFFSCILGTVIHIFTYNHPCCPHDLLDSASFLHFDIFTSAPHLLILTKKDDFSRLPLWLIGCLQPHPLQVDGLHGERLVLLGDHRGYQFQHLRADTTAAGVTRLFGGLLDLCQILCLYEAEVENVENSGVPMHLGKS